MFKWKKKCMELNRQCTNWQMECETAVANAEMLFNENKELKLQLAAIRKKGLVELPQHLLEKLVVHHSAADNACHMLRCLINYHVRMTTANAPEYDHYLHALQYALSLAEKELEKEKNEAEEVKG